MKRFLILLVIVALCFGCARVKELTKPTPTIITDNMGTVKEEDDKIITVDMKSDAHLKYTKTADGYTLEIDNRGRPGFMESAAQKILDKTDIVVGAGVDRVEQSD